MRHISIHSHSQILNCLKKKKPKIPCVTHHLVMQCQRGKSSVLLMSEEDQGFKIIKNGHFCWMQTFLCHMQKRKKAVKEAALLISNFSRTARNTNLVLQKNMEIIIKAVVLKLLIGL
ncbi:Hypothetical predicted protein [Podarcis lilfordi]|uniref:Uncharacterized protein n=1 Tax=Podarcis lilfordi TaxID=74358 RepID=A0AA35KIB7_9SAUR|nr:Hypothetical predicted protein [Podarcis lilfordi]